MVLAHVKESRNARASATAKEKGNAQESAITQMEEFVPELVTVKAR
jgi:hypothetical protein